MKIIIILAVVFTGCISNREKPNFEPLPPEKLRDLRFICAGYAYKSITKKDYNCEENCG